MFSKRRRPDAKTLQGQEGGGPEGNEVWGAPLSAATHLISSTNNSKVPTWNLTLPAPQLPGVQGPVCCLLNHPQSTALRNPHSRNGQNIWLPAAGFSIRMKLKGASVKPLSLSGRTAASSPEQHPCQALFPPGILFLHSPLPRRPWGTPAPSSHQWP